MSSFEFNIRLIIVSDFGCRLGTLSTLDYRNADVGNLEGCHCLTNFTDGYKSIDAIHNVRQYYRTHYGFDDTEVSINATYQDGKLFVKVTSECDFNEKRNIFGNDTELTLLDCIKMFLNARISDGLLDEIGLCIYNGNAYELALDELETAEATDGDFAHCLFLTK